MTPRPLEALPAAGRELPPSHETPDKTSDSKISNAKNIPHSSQSVPAPGQALEALSPPPSGEPISKPTQQNGSAVSKERRQALAEIAPAQIPAREKNENQKLSRPPHESAPATPAESPPRAGDQTSSPLSNPGSDSHSQPDPPPGLPDLMPLLRKGAYQQAADQFQQTLQGNQEQFTISLEVACQRLTLRRALEHAEYHPSLFLLPRGIEERACFALLWGVYNSTQSATQAIGALPDYFKQQTPPPRIVRLRTYLSPKIND